MGLAGEETGQQVTRPALGGSRYLGTCSCCTFPGKSREGQGDKQNAFSRTSEIYTFSSQQNLECIWFHLLTFGEEKTEVSGRKRLTQSHTVSPKAKMNHLGLMRAVQRQP